MRLNVARIRRNNCSFVVVAVKWGFIHNTHESERMINWLQNVFGAPVYLVAYQNGYVKSRGERRDILNWLSQTSPQTLPWEQVTLN